MGVLDRRTFIIGAAGAAGLAGAGSLLAACGDDTAATSTTTTTAEPLATPLLVPSFADGLASPSPFVHSVEHRVAYVLNDGNGIMRRNAPDEIRLEVVDDAGTTIAGGVSVRRDLGVPTPYYSIFFTPPAAGVYRTVLTNDAGTSEHEFLVLEPGETAIPQPGDLLPPIPTATSADPAGVDPICTRVDPCPFHDTDLVDALAAGDRPTILSIATPGFCQTAICGPVIDLLIDATAERDDLRVIHAEVYVDPFNDEGLASGTGGSLTDIVNAYELPYEPVLFVVGTDGVILRRLDAVYDGSELAEALALV
ncbi:MAG: hypothetical protein R2707_15645 [Acidimicrobiales bacterium]